MTKLWRLIPVTVAILCIIALTATRGIAADYTWVGGFSPDPSAWNEAAIWSGGTGVPGSSPSDNVTIPAGVSYTPQLDSGSYNINNLACNDALTITGESLTIGGTGSIASSKTLTLYVNGTWDWYGGTLSGGGGGLTSVSSGGALNIKGTSQKYLDNSEIRNSGTATFTTTNSVYIDNEGKFTNNSGGRLRRFSAVRPFGPVFSIAGFGGMDSIPAGTLSAQRESAS